MGPQEDFRYLYRYFGNYLHEDWMYQHEDPNSAFEAFLSLLTRPDLVALLAEFNRLFALSNNEQESVLAVINVHEDVEADFGWNEREWLQSLRDRAAAELAKRTVSDS